MATYTERLTDWPLPPELHRPMIYVPTSAKPTTRDIVRRRRTPHDANSAAQRWVRSLMRFAGIQWHTLTWDESHSWTNPYYPDVSLGVIKHFNFLLARWAGMHPPSRAYPPSDDPSEIAIAAILAVPGDALISLLLSTSAQTNLSGVVLLRASAPITIPDHATAIVFIPITFTGPHTFTDAHPLPSCNHYRAAAFEKDGKLGAFSDDVFTTPL